ncbi:MAG: ribonuclease R [Bacilli bacterium]|nr:ribonuclease R [Bacilli bacterium]
MKDNIIEYLGQDSKAKTLIEINDYLQLTSSIDLENLQKEINELVKEGVVHETKKCKYLLMKDCASLHTGKIDIAKNGYGFLIQENGEEDIFINRDNLNGAINDDIALVDTFTRNGKVESKVIKILERKLNRVIGEILYVNDKPTIILDDKKIDIQVKLENHFANLVDGHKVLVELVKQLGDKKFLGVVLKIIGHKNDPDIDILSIAYKHGIELEFSDEVKEELKNIPESVLDSDKIGRVDLTKELIFTIDGDDTKDIDDAISVKKENGIYELGVHIADVTYYVRPKTALYNEAYKRGTSSYLADRVLPMLPHELSNGICSLNPEVERLAISCVMKIDASGEIKDYDIFPSVIKSRKQMTYKNVNKIIIDGIVPDGYEEYKDSILLMHELAKILRKRKIQKGYIEFDIPEAKIVQDENGKCIDVIKREQLDGEKLIEDFMIAANETVATHIYNMGLPFVYRVHGIPKTEKINDFINLLKLLNIKVNTKGIDSSSKGMQKILNELKDLKEAPILSSMLLRSMQKAVYSPNNIGHFGLALKNYTHFTSPIRRFPDTTVHGLLRTYLFNKQIDNETIDFYQNYLIEVADYSSEREQAAVEAEREVTDMKMAEYMESHIGEEYKGIITTVTNFGFFVELPNLIEGLVHISTLKEYYNYVPDLLSLVNSDKKKMYRIGDEVTIRVTNASKEMRIIDFEVVDGNSKQESQI